MLIADETGDIKKGVKSVGVARQHTGVTGPVENAQVSVHLSYGSARGGRSSTGSCIRAGTGRAPARSMRHAAARPACPGSGPGRW
ncbi:transposase [Streptomyces sp. NPDC096030]|uniref:transposase n=1 Tax=Streptomyces sp. NPDC096030 TaxID=3155423 RepID=UPI00332377C4